MVNLEGNEFCYDMYAYEILLYVLTWALHV